MADDCFRFSSPNDSQLSGAAVFTSRRSSRITFESFGVFFRRLAGHTERTDYARQNGAVLCVGGGIHLSGSDWQRVCPILQFSDRQFHDQQRMREQFYAATDLPDID